MSGRLIVARYLLLLAVFLLLAACVALPNQPTGPPTPTAGPTMPPCPTIQTTPGYMVVVPTYVTGLPPPTSTPGPSPTLRPPATRSLELEPRPTALRCATQTPIPGVPTATPFPVGTGRSGGEIIELPGWSPHSNPTQEPLLGTPTPIPTMLVYP
jgi:hypothetical protein